MAELTPMMKQYLEIKKDNPDSILFFRLGDFYEMFADDAKLASRELALTLTSRDHGKHAKPEEERVPMCGIPYHASEAYIARLIAKGYKVAICEQMEDPATAKGLVKRDIIRVVTPGTVIDAACLEEKASNFLCGIYIDSQNAGAAFCDISTGKTHLTAFSGPDRVEHVVNELGRFSPAEAVVNDGAASEKALTDALTEKFRCRVENGGEGRFRLAEAERNIRRQFGEEAFDRLPRTNPAAAMALGGLLHYLYETQKTDLSHINDLDYYEQGRFMELDLTARRNLELTETLRDREKRGSLLWVLDKTRTPMGGRLLRSWLERPLLSVTAIAKRNAAVAALVESTMAREELIAALTGLGDMERLIGRIVYGTAGGRDMVSLRSAIERLPALRAQLAAFSGGRLAELAGELDDLTEIGAHIGAAICDEPPFSVREGGFIRDGYHEEVDRLRHIMNGGKGVLAEIEAKEKERTGIRTLKVGYNKVFGYYIEVSKSFAGSVPSNYIRRQTLANSERYVTDELKDMESRILSAKERLFALEYEIFQKLREVILQSAERIKKAAAVLAELDVYTSFATTAADLQMVRPLVDDSDGLSITEGRHIVVEKHLKKTYFVPNDCRFDGESERLLLITGPNMAGKSTYMRQVALIVLLAQIGSFVPAAQAHIGLADKIFTRVGASDDLAGGSSTFMLEMSEVATILRSATKRSLIVYDEIGRGTSTFDGMSIARAVMEYTVGHIGARTLFATHYHELTALEGACPGVVNYNIAAKKRGGEIIFLRKIVRGAADESYGIEVASLAGVPKEVVGRAREILSEIETDSVRAVPRPAAAPQVSAAAEDVLDRLRALNVETITPIEAMSILYELKNASAAE